MAKALKKTLQKAQKMGRGRDTLLAHITPEEARLLKARGGRGSRNPRTGLLEFEEDGEVLEGEEDYSYQAGDVDLSTDDDSDSYDPTYEYTQNGLKMADPESVTYPVRNTDSGGSDNNQQQVVATTTTAAAPVSIQDQIRNELKGWGGTTEQIDAILTRLVMGERKPTSGDPDDDPYGPGTSNADLTTILNQLKEVPEEDRIVYLIDNYGGDVIEEWGGAGGTQAIPLNDATRASELQKPQEQRLQEAVDLQVLGSSTGEGLEDNGDGSFTDLDTGTTYYRGEDGKLTDRDGNVRYDPGTGLAAQIDYNQQQQSLAEQQLYGDEGLVSDITNLSSDYASFTDATRDSLDDPNNDFAGLINNQLNAFLHGDYGQKGFLDYQADLLGASKDFKAQLGDLSTQYDQAYAQNQGDVNRLRDDYNRLSTDYARDLAPYQTDLAGIRQRLGDVTQGQFDIARDAKDESYYSKLRDVLYRDAANQIQQQTDSSRDSIQQMYASSGADPTSPAYMTAMTDLQNNRVKATQSAQRQALLDSYGLGSQMLGNRSQALSGAGAALGAEGSAIGAEMGALNSLYGIRNSALQADASLTGQQMQNRIGALNTRGDMIGRLYNVNRDAATTGMQGLNTVMNTNINAINSRSDQFYKNIGLQNDLYGGQMDSLGNAANAVGNQLNYYGAQRQNAFDTLLEANQGQKSDAFSYATLEKLYGDAGMEMPDFVNNAFGK